MSKTNNIEMQNAVYGVQNEIVQDAIRRAHRERAEVLSALVRRIFQRGETVDVESQPDWTSHSTSGVR